MTRIQQILWELTMDYIGHPYYVTGNAIYHALAATLDYETSRQLRASHGMFAPGQFGRYPTDYSQSGTKPYMGATLAKVESYDDLFLFRHSEQSWLLDSRPRDALNTHDIRVHAGHPGLAHETLVGQPADHPQDRQTTTWYVHAYLHADDPSVLPLGEAALDGLRFGGKRNYGYGTTRLKDTQVLDLEALDYARLEGVDTYTLELVTPFVLRSEYPGTTDTTVPWWWDIDDDCGLRRRVETIVEQRDAYNVATIDHGQVVGYAGGHPIETAKNGITRIGTHSKYGFGELRVRPLGSGGQSDEAAWKR